jgi:hypothetical protein
LMVTLQFLTNVKAAIQDIIKTLWSFK